MCPKLLLARRVSPTLPTRSLRRPAILHSCPTRWQQLTQQIQPFRLNDSNEVRIDVREVEFQTMEGFIIKDYTNSEDFGSSCGSGGKVSTEQLRHWLTLCLPPTEAVPWHAASAVGSLAVGECLDRPPSDGCLHVSRRAVLPGSCLSQPERQTGCQPAGRLELCAGPVRPARPPRERRLQLHLEGHSTQ